MHRTVHNRCTMQLYIVTLVIRQSLGQINASIIHRLYMIHKVQPKSGLLAFVFVFAITAKDGLENIVARPLSLESFIAFWFNDSDGWCLHDRL